MCRVRMPSSASSRWPATGTPLYSREACVLFDVGFAASACGLAILAYEASVVRPSDDFQQPQLRAIDGQYRQLNRAQWGRFPRLHAQIPGRRTACQDEGLTMQNNDKQRQTMSIRCFASFWPVALHRYQMMRTLEGLESRPSTD